MFRVPENYRIIGGPLASCPNDGNNGAFVFMFKGQEVFCIASDNDDWEHVSVTCRYPSNKSKHPPNWSVMSKVKSVFWDAEDAVMQLHPPESEYVDFQPFCLHLWRPANGEFLRPPKYLVNAGIE